MEDLRIGGLAGGAFDIAEDGTVVGASSTADAPYNPRPALWIDQNATLLDTRGGIAGAAMRINSQASIVGWVEQPEFGYSHPFQWDAGIATDLGVFGSDLNAGALALNNSDQIVGWSGEGYGDGGDGSSEAYRAVLWSGGAVLDLNALIPPNSGWHLAVATDIDDQGRIIGRGLYNGNVSGFLLTPVPEPGTFVLVAFALVWLRRFSRK